MCTCVDWFLEDEEQDESQKNSKLKKSYDKEKTVKFGREVRRRLRCYVKLCLWWAYTRILTGLWNQKEVPISQWSVEIRVLYTLAKGQRQDPKRSHHKCLEVEDRLQTTGPVVPKFCYLQKTREKLSKYWKLWPHKTYLDFPIGRCWESALSRK